MQEGSKEYDTVVKCINLGINLAEYLSMCLSPYLLSKALKSNDLRQQDLKKCFAE